MLNSSSLILRPFQEAALKALNHPSRPCHHILCVAPTGSGKSLIYEKAAACTGRRTLLITPLVALARQQFERLKQAQIPVTLGAGNDSQGPPRGESGAWIISPETLNFASKKNVLKRWNPNLLVVDECHCLWEWGENFRPSFALIPNLIHHLHLPKSLWLTATLPFEARCEWKQRVPSPITEIGEFNLPANLFLKIQQVSWENRTQAILQCIKKMKGAGIIFVPTRESSERIGKLMTAFGKRTVTYHGGMSGEERKNLENLISKKIPDLIVATSAFGMGMDYQHLKDVILWQAPTSLLSLVQAVGRVGRNTSLHSGHSGYAKPLDQGLAHIFWHPDDFRMLEWTLGDSQKRRTDLKDLLHFFETPFCRTAQLKFYFDRKVLQEPCHSCDICQHE